MLNTKEKLCEVAIKLFNEYGYNKVSLREIATKANTTIGNLTYHFPRKENLLEEILKEMYNIGFQNYQNDDLHGEYLLDSLVASFIKAKENELNNLFYYRNILELTNLSLSIKEKNRYYQEKIYTYYCNTLFTLQMEGIISSKFLESDVRSLAYTMITISTVWAQDNTPTNNPKLPDFTISEILCDLLLAYIDIEYLEYYRELCKVRLNKVG